MNKIQNIKINESDKLTKTIKLCFCKQVFLI